MTGVCCLRAGECLLHGACECGWRFQSLLDAEGEKEIEFVGSGFAGDFLVVLMDIWGEL